MTDIIVEERYKIKLKLKQKQSLTEQFPIRREIHTYDNLGQLSSSDKGDRIVCFVYDCLQAFDNLSETANVSGISNNIFDIIVRTKIDCKLRGIQIKTLTKDQRKDDSWQCKVNGHVYPNDTLMIFINSEINRFCFCFWRQIAQKSTFFVTYNNSKSCEFFKCTNIPDFKCYLYSMILSAVVINDVKDGIITENNKKEFDAMQRLKNLCEKRNIRFEYNYTNSSPIDIYLDNYACQCKFTTTKNNLYHVTLFEKSPTSECDPYKDTDGIDYFIFQIHDDDNPYQYYYDVLIIPTTVLIDMGYIKTELQRGRTNICIPPPYSHTHHIFDSFWNNFSIIGNNIISDPIYIFSRKHKCVIKNTSVKHGKIYQTYISYMNIQNSEIEYFLFFLNDGEKRLYVDFVLVISKVDMVNTRHTTIYPDKNIQVTIAPPDYKRPHWSLKYWQKITELNLT